MAGALDALDALFGPDHGLLTAGDAHPGGGTAFGLAHGVWTHTGWTVLKDLQVRWWREPTTPTYTLCVMVLLRARSDLTPLRPGGRARGPRMLY
jgi:hypothetical protein